MRPLIFPGVAYFLKRRIPEENGEGTATKLVAKEHIEIWVGQPGSESPVFLFVYLQKARQRVENSNLRNRERTVVAARET